MKDSTPAPSTAADVARGALAELVAGNRRFAEGNPTPQLVSAERRAELVGGQSPKAVVLGCVDARVPTEVVLDQGVGDLLTMRTAGQALTGSVLGSIEFGVRVLGIPLVVVLGHTGCGAVAAALADNRPDSHLGDLLALVAKRLTDVADDDPNAGTRTNLDATVESLRGLDTLVTPDGERAHVVGLLYDLATGVVTVTDDAGLG